jgi:putative redox protein
MVLLELNGSKFAKTLIMKSQTVHFTNAQGFKLAGKLELPLDKKPSNFAIFAHCFTCGKDLKAERNIALGLKQAGIAVLRFDFTGLGQSEGDFADSHFSSNVEDLESAAQYLSDNHQAPSLLIGHSLGGTAVLMAAPKIASVKAVVTIGAPCEPEHVLNLITGDLETIEEKGEAKVSLAGRPFTLKKQFVDDLRNHGLKKEIEKMRGLSLLILHSPQDDTVGIENARHIYAAAHHPKSFISLDGADHLLSNKKDSLYVGSVIAGWAKRYLPGLEEKDLETNEQVLALLEEGPFLTHLLAGQHHIIADEPESVGGQNLGPSPYELVTAGLGACTAMTLKMYANRKDWPVKEIKVHLSFDGDYAEDCAQCEDQKPKMGQFKRLIEVTGDLNEQQEKRLMAIANKCPVHRTLEQGVTITTELKIIS